MTKYYELDVWHKFDSDNVEYIMYHCFDEHEVDGVAIASIRVMLSDGEVSKWIHPPTAYCPEVGDSNYLFKVPSYEESEDE